MENVRDGNGWMRCRITRSSNSLDCDLVKVNRIAKVQDRSGPLGIGTKKAGTWFPAVWI
jgi:hypothetical protein